MQSTMPRQAVGRRIAPSVQSARIKANRFIQREIVRRVRSYGLSVAIDVLIVLAAFEAATAVRFSDGATFAEEVQRLFVPCLLAGALYAAVSYLFGLHRRLWRYAGVRDGLALMCTVGTTSVLIAGLDLVGLLPTSQRSSGAALRALPLSVVLGGAFLSFLFLGGVKVVPKILHARPSGLGDASAERVTQVLIVGAGQAGAALAARLTLNGTQGYRVVGFVDDDPSKWHARIRGIPVLDSTEAIPHLVERYSVDLIALALSSADPMRIGQLIARCQETSASIKILPSLAEFAGRQPSARHLRDVNVADLLGREVVPLRSAESGEFLAGRSILVTGAAGSIGAELCRQLLDHAPRHVIALDNNESGLFDLAASLHDHPDQERLQLRIGDITNQEDMSRLFATARPQVVFHAAAYKHVPLLEEHPDQAARINVLGTYHLTRQARVWATEVFVFVSTDKAADPVSVLGASKRAGERIVQALATSGQSATRFCAVRFGNVIGSRGSVVPTFIHQIERGEPITVTDPEATRYFMTIPEACGLVIRTATLADGESLFLLDMGDPVRIADLAAKMIRMRGLRVGHDIPIVYTGLRPGERLHEALVGADEVLLPSNQTKIARVIQLDEIPPLGAIESALSMLDDLLAQGDRSLLRQSLFALARGRDLAQLAHLGAHSQPGWVLPADLER